MMNKRAFLVGACVLAVVFLTLVVNRGPHNDVLEDIVEDRPKSTHSKRIEREEEEFVPQKRVAKRTLHALLPGSKIESILEWYFMKNILLGALDRPVEFHKYPDFPKDNKDEWQYMNDSMVFSFFRNAFEVNADEYFNWVKAHGGKNIGVFHMGDEVHKASIKHYAQADYIIRNYYYADIFTTYGADKVVWIPNGFASGVGPRDPANLKKSSQRTLNCHFAGRKTAERAAFIETLNKVAPDVCMLETTKSFGQGLPKSAYGDQLSNVVIAPCPIGNTVETIRFYDSLECGAIPVMTDSPYAQMLLKEAQSYLTSHGRNPYEDREIKNSNGFAVEKRKNVPMGPFFVIDSWEDFNDVITPLLQDVELLDDIQENTIQWWADFKVQKAKEIRDLVDASFEKHYGRGA